MPVDRGGLRYPIVVENNFTGPINDFKSQVKSAGKAFDDFKNRIQGSAAQTVNTAKGLNQLNAAVRRAANNQEALANATDRANVANAESIAVNEQLINQKRQLQGQSNASNALIGGLRREQAAVNALANAYQKLAKAKADAGADGARAINLNSNNKTVIQTPRPALAGGVKTALTPSNAKEQGQGLLSLQSILQRTQSIADRASFSMQRLFTVLFAFAIVRTISTAFTDLIGKMITFNSNVEKSVLSIASLVLATGQVKDATGETVDSAFGLAIAQKEARKQTDLLRKDAIATAATFEDLLKTFQTAIGPGLQNGLSLDQIRKFTVQVSQAAAAIGLPQNQLAEEIRSILSGSINIRNTRLAAALGITNADIKNAKEQGNLLGFLQKKFSAFTTAGQEALGTFDVLFQSVNDGLTLIIGSGGIEFFTSLKSLLKDIFQTITTADPITGLITPKPEAVALVQDIAKALVHALDEARALGKELGFGSFRAVSKTVAQTIEISSKVLSGFIQGFVKGLGTIQAIFQVIGVAIENIFGKDLFGTDQIKNTVAIVTQFLTVFLSIIAAAKLFLVVLSPIAIVIGSIVTTFGALKAVLSTALALFSAIGVQGFLVLGTIVATIAAVVGIFEVLRLVASEFFGVNLKAISLLRILEAVGRLIVTSILNGLSLVGVLVVKSFELAFRTVTHIGQNILDFMINIGNAAAISLFKSITSVLNLIPKESRPKFIQDIIDAELEQEKTAKRLKAIQEAQANDRKKKLSDTVNETDEMLKQLKISQEQATTGAEKAISNALVNNDNVPTIKEFAKEVGGALQDAISQKITETFDKLKQQVPKFDPQFTDNKVAVESLQSLTDLFDGLPGVISPARESTHEQADALKTLRDELDKTNVSYREGIALLGASGRVLQQRQEQFKLENDLREKTKKLQIDETNGLENLKSIQAQRLVLEGKIEGMTQNQKDLIQEGVDSGKDYLAGQRENAKLLQIIGDKQAELQTARIGGNLKEISAAQDALDLAKEAKLQAEDRLNEQSLINDQLLSTEPIVVQKQIQDAIAGRITLEGQEKAQNETNNGVVKDRLDIERALSEQMSSRIALLAAQEAFEVSSATKLIALETAKSRAAFESRNSLPQEQKLKAIQAEVNITQEQIKQAKILRDINLDNAKLVVDASVARTESLLAQLDNESSASKRAEIERAINVELVAQLNQEQAINALKDQSVAKADDENLKLQQLLETQTQLKLQAEQPVATGILDGFRQAAQEIPTIYQGIVDIIKNSVTGLSDFISTAIVDAFDPTKDLNIQERFARFLQDIAKQVLQLFVQLAIQKAILGLGFLGGGAGGGGLGGLGGLVGGIGFNKGGKVPSPHSSKRAKGFSEGTPMRPAHISPRDKVAAWLEEGEHVTPVKRVMQYGADFFEHLRLGLADPTTMRAAAGISSGSARRVKPASGPGYADGGLIRGRAAPTRETTRKSNIADGPTPAFIVANDQNVERLLSGGKSGLFNVIQQNAGRIKALLK